MILLWQSSRTTIWSSSFPSGLGHRGEPTPTHRLVRMASTNGTWMTETLRQHTSASAIATFSATAHCLMMKRGMSAPASVSSLTITTITERPISTASSLSASHAVSTSTSHHRAGALTAPANLLQHHLPHDLGPPASAPPVHQGEPYDLPQSIPLHPKLALDPRRTL